MPSRPMCLCVERDGKMHRLLVVYMEGWSFSIEADKADWLRMLNNALRDHEST